jgi:hypothetical protein
MAPLKIPFQPCIGFIFLIIYFSPHEIFDRKPSSTKQMRPNVSSLGVNAENGPEASIESGQRRSVAGVQEVIVLQPVGQVLEVAHVPGYLPHLQSGKCTFAVKMQTRNAKRKSTFMTNSSACSAAL